MAMCLFSFKLDRSFKICKVRTEDLTSPCADSGISLDPPVHIYEQSDLTMLGTVEGLYKGYSLIFLGRSPPDGFDGLRHCRGPSLG